MSGMSGIAMGRLGRPVSMHRRMNTEERLADLVTFSLLSRLPSPLSLSPSHPPVPPTCTHCPLSTNLWLCLTCGSVNCGRKQIGGADGNGHALEHFKETGHGVGVKLGTITVEGGGGGSSKNVQAWEGRAC